MFAAAQARERETMGRTLRTTRACVLVACALAASWTPGALAGAVVDLAALDFESSLLRFTGAAMKTTHGPVVTEGDGVLRYTTGLYPPETIDLDLPQLRGSSALEALRWSNRWRQLLSSVYLGGEDMVDYWAQGVAGQESVAGALGLEEHVLSPRTFAAMRPEPLSSHGAFGRSTAVGGAGGAGGGGGGGGGGPSGALSLLPPTQIDPLPDGGPVVEPGDIPDNSGSGPRPRPRPRPRPSPTGNAPGAPGAGGNDPGSPGNPGVPGGEVPVDPVDPPLPPVPPPGSSSGWTIDDLLKGGWEDPGFSGPPRPPVGIEPGGPGLVAVPIPSAVGLGAAGLLALGARLRRRAL